MIFSDNCIDFDWDSFVNDNMVPVVFFNKCFIEVNSFLISKPKKNSQSDLRLHCSLKKNDSNLKGIDVSLNGKNLEGQQILFLMSA